jgi:replicative DNA helicase
MRGEFGRSSGVLIHDLLEAVPVTTTGPHYARIVLEQAARRRLVQAGIKLVQLAQQPPDGPGDLDELMRSVVQELACVRAAVDTYHRGDPQHLQLTEPAAAGRSLRTLGPER